MPPKKREKDGDSSKNQRMDQNQADHELFLQAFEKPTQIYRFLRTRNMLSPVFLNRTLSYMRQRMSRSHKTRRGFKVDSLLDRLERNQSSSQPTLSGYMTLTFLGFYDKKNVEDCQDELVKVETLLLKICHKKRKDVSCPVMTVSLGTSFVPYNPSEDYPPSKAPAVSIPTESFSLSNGHLVKSYHLLLRVGMNSPSSFNTKTEIDSEPPQKKKKSIKGADEESGDWHQFGTDLIIYDKQNRCLLSDGDYELLLEELNTNTSGAKISHGLSTWEYFNQLTQEEPGEHLTSFEKFSSGPTLKFRLRWSREPITPFVDRPKPAGTADETVDNNSNKENNRPDRVGKIKLEPVPSSSSKLQIVYQFLYNNNSRQQTEACEDLHCPWCSLDCSSLYSLLKHLKLCHSRFTFTYVPIPQGARIDVALNEHYDGSYTGSPQDLISQPGSGLAFSRNGPVRRTSVSNILVCHPKRPRPSLSEFLELDENEFDGQRPYVTGHNRLYHHTTTCLPVHAKEMDIDSEDENDPKWLQTKTMMMIDEFTDVNEGEKELMKMWNLHVMRHGYVGDCQIPLACNMFLQARGKELLLKNLYRNFVLHMCNLFDFGLISPVTVYMTIQKLQQLIATDGDESKVLQDSCAAQRKHWIQEGANKAAADVRRLPASPAERRKLATIFTPQPIKSEKVMQRIFRAASPSPENVSKKRTTEPEKKVTEQPERNGDVAEPPAKKKSLGDKINGMSRQNVDWNLNTGNKPGVAEKKKNLVKNENSIKKKQPLTNEVTTKNPTPQQELKGTTNNKTATPPAPDMVSKLRRKSSTASLKETSTATYDSGNPVVVLRRKSFAGATDILRKKSVENGVNTLPNLILSDSRRKDGAGVTTNKTNVS